MMSTDQLQGSPPVSSRSPPVGMILVLVLAGFLYAFMVACLADADNAGSDAFGRGLAAAFGALFGLVVWVLLGIALWIAAVKGEMPRPAGIAAFILLPLSAVAGAIAFDLGPATAWWLPWVPLLMPPPIAAFALWARLPALHRTLQPQATAVVLLGMVLALTIAPLPFYVGKEMQRIAEARREAAAQRAAEAAEAERRQPEPRALPKADRRTSPLWEWAPFIGRGSEARRSGGRRRESADPQAGRRGRGVAPRFRLSAGHLRPDRSRRDPGVLHRSGGFSATQCGGPSRFQGRRAVSRGRRRLRTLSRRDRVADPEEMRPGRRDRPDARSGGRISADELPRWVSRHVGVAARQRLLQRLRQRPGDRGIRYRTARLARQRAVLLQPRQRLLRKRPVRPGDRRLHRGHSP